MTFESYTRPFLWTQYSEKLRQRILHPHSAGEISEKESQERGCRLFRAHSGDMQMGYEIKLFFLVDKDDTIIDMKFQVFGSSVLVGVLEAISELLVRKQTHYVASLSIEEIDKALRDSPKRAAFPQEAMRHVRLAYELCQSAFGLTLPLGSASPFPQAASKVKKYPQFTTLSKEEQKKIIEEILDLEIRPYIALDEGGVSLVDISDGHTILIAYSGTCATCFAAHGSTLAYIQEMIQSHLDDPIVVRPVE